MLRPGRFDDVVYVPPPDLAGRREVFAVHTRGMHLARDVDVGMLAMETERYTGAEIQMVCREAHLAAARRRKGKKKGGQKGKKKKKGWKVVVRREDFEEARGMVRPALDAWTLQKYEAFGRARAGRMGMGRRMGME